MNVYPVTVSLLTLAHAILPTRPQRRKKFVRWGRQSVDPHRCLLPNPWKLWCATRGGLRWQVELRLLASRLQDRETLPGGPNVITRSLHLEEGDLARPQHEKALAKGCWLRLEECGRLWDLEEAKKQSPPDPPERTPPWAP